MDTVIAREFPESNQLEFTRLVIMDSNGNDPTNASASLVDDSDVTRSEVGGGTGNINSGDPIFVEDTEEIRLEVSVDDGASDVELMVKADYRVR